ncbi:MAG TPA: alkaline phosphatase family protein [Longimicrobiales bacterium]|nr:alkaline phosphatase family protein [Longimicrobiales bacterium]
MPRVLLFFVDGVGLGMSEPDINPLVVARLPTFSELLDGDTITLRAAPATAERASLVALDATLGFEGIPQSGTGQASLLTGANAVEMHGRHFGPWVPSRLRTFVREQSVLARALDAGHRVAFANAYPEELNQLPGGAGPAVARDRTRSVRRGPAFLRAGPPLAALGANLLTRHTPDLERGDAVASELTNEGWRERLGRRNVPIIDAAHAGRNLARIAARNDLTLFAHYSTDYAGHQRDMQAAVGALERLDAFLAGVLETGNEDLLIVLASDHGNIEDVRTGHTRNPALGMVVGRGHAALAARLRSLTDVTPLILHVLSD